MLKHRFRVFSFTAVWIGLSLTGTPPTAASDEKDWRQVTSVRDAVETAPEQMEALPTTVASYEAEIAEGTTTFAWLILPGEDEVPEARAELIEADASHATVRVRIGDRATREVRIELP